MRVGVLLILAAVGGVLILGRSATAATAAADALPQSEAALIAAGIAPVAIPVFQPSISLNVVGSVVATVESAIAKRKATRAGFTQLWPLVTGSEQHEWIGRKSLSLHTSLFNARSRHTRLRQFEDGMVAKYIGTDAADQAPAIARNANDPSWITTKPDNINVDFLVVGTRGVSAEHTVVVIKLAAWDRIRGVADDPAVIRERLRELAAARAGLVPPRSPIVRVVKGKVVTAEVDKVKVSL